MNLIMSEEECETPGFQRQTLKNEVSVEPCDMQGRQPGGSRRVWCCTRLLQRASAYMYVFSCIVFYIFFSPRPCNLPLTCPLRQRGCLRGTRSGINWRCALSHLCNYGLHRGERDTGGGIFVLFFCRGGGGAKTGIRKRLGPLPDNGNHFTYEWLGSQVVPDGFFCCLMDSGMLKRWVLVWVTPSEAI